MGREEKALMETAHNIKLTSAEIGMLWTTYINDTMARCVLGYFLNKVEDTEIQPVIAFALKVSEEHVGELTELFHSEKFPVPQGFSDEDVNVNAKRLFSDSLFLYYIKNMSKVGLTAYAMSYAMSSRSDVRAFYSRALTQTQTLDQLVTELLLSKGLYIRPPYISTPDSIDFVESSKFLSGGFFGFMDKRPLTSIEIAHLFANIQTNALGKALLTGFQQVAKSQVLIKYLERGVHIAGKHIEIFDKTLKDDELPVPMTWDSDVMDSKESPFSDKLILFHVALLVTVGSGNYGLAASASPRKDVAATYVRLAAEIAIYTLDGAKIMIDHGWMEEPPLAPDRKKLAHS